MKKFTISFLAISIMLLSSLALLSSCATQSRCQQLYPASTNNTETVKVEKETVYKDSIVYRTLAADTVRVEQIVSSAIPDLPIIKAENKYCIAQSWVSGGTQFLNMTIKPVKLEFTTQNKIVSQKTEALKQTKTTATKPYIPKVYSWSLYIVFIEFMLLISWLLYKLRGLLFKIK